MNLADLSTEELAREFNLAPYKAKQIYRHIRRGVTDFDAMTDLSKALREQLRQNHTVSFPVIHEKYASKLDETVKYLVKLNDGNIIETVLMRYQHGNSVCVSTQVGCRMGCSFCASTMGGLIRNLTPSEIEGQIRAVSADCGQRIHNVVLMGIGEPLDNFDNVLCALCAINDENGLGIGYRHITLSTCGLPDGMRRLIDKKLPITLALSLHAPTDELRREIMPAAKNTTIGELIGLCADYAKETGRRVTIEYSLIGGVNDSTECAEKLATLLKGMLVHVNLIDINPVKGRRYKRGNNLSAFVSCLEKRGIAATVRRELGADISASCGQLVKSRLSEE